VDNTLEGRQSQKQVWLATPPKKDKHGSTKGSMMHAIREVTPDHLGDIVGGEEITSQQIS
jgi:hypothetical protein